MAYTVVKGDTLSAIARANGTTVAELLTLNPDITDANLIRIDQQINLPSDQTASTPETTTAEPAAPASDTVQPEGQAGYSGIMDGGTVHLVKNPTQEDFYVVSYEYPPGSGHSFFYRFSKDQLEAAIGPDMGGGTVEIGAPLDESSLSVWTDAGDSSEIVGVEGTFDAFMQDMLRDASAAAGGTGIDLAAAAASDPDIALLMVSGAQAGWTSERYKAEIRKTDYYKHVLYPGIENFYGQTTDPETAYKQYVSNISSVAKTLGIKPGADGTYKDTAAELLSAGVTDQAFASFAPTYQRAQANAGFADALSKWTERYTGKSISSFSDWFDVLAGTAPAEVTEIADVAGLAWAAESSGFDVSDDQLKSIADASDWTEGQARSAFSTAGKALLGLGDTGLARYGLTKGQVIDAAFGVETQGVNPEEVRRKIDKTMTEIGLQDDHKAQFYASFNQRGALVKPGLQAVTPEAG